MFRPYMWAIFRLRSNFPGAAIQDVWGVGLGVGEERDLVVPIAGIMTWDYYKWIIISFLCTCVKVGFYSYAKDKLLLVAYPLHKNRNPL